MLSILRNSLPNIMVSASNLSVIIPLYQSVINQDYLTTTIISFVGVMSTISHLIENHKHGMPGIGLSQHISILTNRLDVIGAVIIGSRLIHMFYQKFGFDVGHLIFNHSGFLLASFITFLMGFVSEYDKYNPKLRSQYMITHCFWHTGVYSSMYYFLKNII